MLKGGTKFLEIWRKAIWDFVHDCMAKEQPTINCFCFYWKRKRYWDSRRLFWKGDLHKKIKKKLCKKQEKNRKLSSSFILQKNHFLLTFSLPSKPLPPHLLSPFKSKSLPLLFPPCFSTVTHRKLSFSFTLHHHNIFFSISFQNLHIFSLPPAPPTTTLFFSLHSPPKTTNLSSTLT